MNRINTIIDNYATMEVIYSHSAVLFAHDGFFDESAGMTHRMLKARSELKMWIKISQAIRGWQL